MPIGYLAQREPINGRLAFNVSSSKPGYAPYGGPPGSTFCRFAVSRSYFASFAWTYVDQVSGRRKRLTKNIHMAAAEALCPLPSWATLRLAGRSPVITLDEPYTLLDLQIWFEAVENRKVVPIRPREVLP